MCRDGNNKMIIDVPHLLVEIKIKTLSQEEVNRLESRADFRGSKYIVLLK